MTDEERGKPRRLHGLQLWHCCATVASGMTLPANTPLDPLSRTTAIWLDAKGQVGLIHLDHFFQLGNQLGASGVGGAHGQWSLQA
jgi:hypothetical protein